METTTVPTRGLPPTHVRIWRHVEAEDGARRPVLLALHGWTDSGEVFGPLAAALGRRWTVVAPDAPGHGGTRWRHSAGYDLEEHPRAAAAVLAALPDLLGARRPVVVLGHSLGGLTAAALGARRPAGLAHLVLEDPARTTPRRTTSPAARLAWLEPLAAMAPSELDTLSRRENAGWPDDEHEPWARSKTEVDLDHLRVPTHWGEPLVAHLAETSVPVTLVRGEPARGGIVSMTAARRCAAACPRGAEVVALDAGHNPRREARAPFVAVLASVLGRYET